MDLPTRIRNKPQYLRTAYWGDCLKLVTGLGARTLWRRVNEHQYERHGLLGPGEDTVRDFFQARTSPPLEAKSPLAPGWLFAAEAEFPGSSYAFFHPAFDLLFGRVSPSPKASLRAQMFPDIWIQSAKRLGRLDQAEEWARFNASLSIKRGRRPRPEVPSRLTEIRQTLLRLPAPITSVLFTGIGKWANHARKEQSFSDELRLLVPVRNMNGLAALIGLTLEAAELGYAERLEQSKAALQHLLPLVTASEECGRIAVILNDCVSEFCLQATAQRYVLSEITGRDIRSPKDF